MNTTTDRPLGQISRRSLLTTALALPLVFARRQRLDSLVRWPFARRLESEREHRLVESDGRSDCRRWPALAPLLHRPTPQRRLQELRVQGRRHDARRLQLRHLLPHAIPAEWISRQGLRGPDQQYLRRRRKLSRAQEDGLALWRPRHL